MRALIADDDRGAALVLSRVASQCGLETVITHDGDAAWQALLTEPAPSLALIDWMMPGVDGLELCRRIRGDAAHARKYVILLTARESRADVVAGLDAGADDYLVKPFDIDELRARIRVGLRVVSLQERLAEQVAELQSALVQVRQLNGLLPICSYCKRIRNDQNYWQQVEFYVAEHTDATFTHGICPACIDGVRAQFKRDAAAR